MLLMITQNVLIPCALHWNKRRKDYPLIWYSIAIECSVFLFEKKIAEKLHKPKRKETVTELLRASIKQLERSRHPKMLTVIHPVEECADTLAFATEPVYASLANILAYQEVGTMGPVAGPPSTGASQPPQPPIITRPYHAKEYNFLDIEFKYGLLQYIQLPAVVEII
uniref:SCY1-like protein 2 n=1 Tax=Megaselia scalaris TaxID=36166 RepID=T1GGC7_MEGSC